MDLGKDRLRGNTAGDFFVNSSCINCGSCWQIDSEHFSPNGNCAFVHTQPHGQKEVQKALLALIDCPVAAICAPKHFTKVIPEDIFPILVANHPLGEVYYCGWSSMRSYGASSWLVLTLEGNVLIDSPRWSAPLARQIKRMGGVRKMVLTHRDDVADHAQWAKTFGCKRWIHQGDADSAPDCENQVIGMEVIPFLSNMKLIPTPGHTAGSLVVVFGDRQQILFSGDHLWWNPAMKVVVASKEFCWWDWGEQIKSIKRLLQLDIQWLLPGHGYAHQFELGEWQKALEQTLRYIQSS